MEKKVLNQINTLAKSIIDSGNNIDISNTKSTLIQLYEKLSVLEFLKTSLETELNKPVRSAIDSKTYREENWFNDPKPVPQPQESDEIAQPLMDKIKDLVAEIPAEELPDASTIDSFLKEILPKEDVVKNDLEEFAADYQETPVFERKDPETNQKEKKPTIKKNTEAPTSIDLFSEKPKSLNEKLQQGVTIGLNDRLAFTKHLFEGNSNDFTRVLSQINTFSSYEAAVAFINNNVKLDYDNWLGKEDYVERFLSIIEKRFH